MFASRMLLRVPGQSLYLRYQVRNFSLHGIAYEPAKKVVPPPPPPPAPKRTTKKAPAPVSEKPTPRKRLVLSDKERKAQEKKPKITLTEKQKEREKIKKQKERAKERALIKAQKAKEKLAAKEKMDRPYPPPPKRPGTGYIIFFKNRQPKKSESVTERAIATGEEWRALPEAEKQVYNKKAADLYIQWKSDLASWVASLNAAQLKAARENREPGTREEAAFDQLPKRPANAYALFFKNCISQPGFNSRIEDLVKKEANVNGVPTVRLMTTMRGRLAGEEWKKMSEKEKQPYVLKYAELKKEYQASYGSLIAKQQAQIAATI